jgi:RHH-type proline utilization regulon transcriptional repressor/proline dehydrogenase/delta 1-pyrroline-5-carboxylate dehydrogenase
MRIMGGQYVLGRTIEEAMERGRAHNRPSTTFSFDMLGEGARTFEDADHYFDAYRGAIDAIGRANENRPPTTGNGISVNH